MTDNSPNPLQIETPAPLAKFRERVVHPDNLALVEGDDRARTLTRQELKQVKQAIKDCEKLLTRYRYRQRKAKINALKLAFHALKIDLHNLEAVPDFELEPVQAIRREMAKIKREVKALHGKIEPARKAAGRLNRLQSRLTEHHTAVANEKLYELLQKQMALEAKRFASTIIRAWNRLKLCYDSTVEGQSRRDSVRFEYVIATPDELQFKIAVSSLTLLGSTINHLPHGVAAWNLIKEETLRELTISCERNVYSPQVEDGDYRNGAWVVVERLGLVDGLFNYVALPHLLSRYPQDRRDKFPLPMGVKRGRKINWIDLAENPHIFVNGMTKSGKSNTLHVMLSTLIQMHPPSELALILIDLKEGAELLRYEEAPHTYGKVMIDLNQVHQVIYKLEILRANRMKQIRTIAADIDGYNAAVPAERRMRRVVVVIDEYQGIYTNKGIGAEINQVVLQLATKARAAGIHLIIGTQSPYNEVVPNLIKANISLVITGRQRTQGSSMSTLGTKKATELPNIKGRMMCADGADVFPVQMPHAPQEIISAAIEKAKDWPSAPPLELPDDETLAAFTPLDSETEWRNQLIEIALQQLNGDLKAKELWKRLEHTHIGRDRIYEMVKRITDQGEIEYQGNCYKVVRQKGNFYRLLPMDTGFPSFNPVSVAETTAETSPETTS